MGFLNLMDKRKPQVESALASQLAAGETVNLVSEAAINPPSVKTQFASAAASAALSGALGGGVVMMTVPKKFYVVLTTHRLIALNQGPSGKPTSEIVWQASRGALRAGTPGKKGLWTTCELFTDGGAPVALLKFPKPAKADASVMSDLLGRVA